MFRQTVSHLACHPRPRARYSPQVAEALPAGKQRGCQPEAHACHRWRPHSGKHVFPSHRVSSLQGHAEEYVQRTP